MRWDGDTFVVIKTENVTEQENKVYLKFIPIYPAECEWISIVRW